MFYQMMNNFHIYSDFQRRIMKKEFLLFKNKLKPVRKGNFRILQKEKEQFFKKLLLFCVLNCLILDFQLGSLQVAVEVLEL